MTIRLDSVVLFISAKQRAEEKEKKKSYLFTATTSSKLHLTHTQLTIDIGTKRKACF